MIENKIFQKMFFLQNLLQNSTFPTLVKSKIEQRKPMKQKDAK